MIVAKLACFIKILADVALKNRINSINGYYNFKSIFVLLGKNSTIELTSCQFLYFNSILRGGYYSLISPGKYSSTFIGKVIFNNVNFFNFYLKDGIIFVKKKNLILTLKNVKFSDYNIFNVIGQNNYLINLEILQKSSSSIILSEILVKNIKKFIFLDNCIVKIENIDFHNLKDYNFIYFLHINSVSTLVMNRIKFKIEIMSSLLIQLLNNNNIEIDTMTVNLQKNSNNINSYIFQFGLSNICLMKNFYLKDEYNNNLQCFQINSKNKFQLANFKFENIQSRRCFFLNYNNTLNISKFNLINILPSNSGIIFYIDRENIFSLKEFFSSNINKILSKNTTIFFFLSKNIIFINNSILTYPGKIFNFFTSNTIEITNSQIVNCLGGFHFQQNFNSFQMINITFFRMKSSNFYSAIFFNDFSTGEIINFKIYESYTEDQGTIFSFSKNSKIIISHLILLNLKSDKNGGGIIKGLKNNVISLFNASIRNVYNVSGVLFDIIDNTTFSIEQCKINEIKTFGGLMKITKNSIVFIQNCSFYNISSNYSIGLMHFDNNNNLHLLSCNFSNKNTKNLFFAMFSTSLKNIIKFRNFNLENLGALKGFDSTGGLLMSNSMKNTISLIDLIIKNIELNGKILFSFGESNKIEILKCVLTNIRKTSNSFMGVTRLNIIHLKSVSFSEFDGGFYSIGTLNKIKIINSSMKNIKLIESNQHGAFLFMSFANNLIFKNSTFKEVSSKFSFGLIFHFESNNIINLVNISLKNEIDHLYGGFFLCQSNNSIIIKGLIFELQKTKEIVAFFSANQECKIKMNNIVIGNFENKMGSLNFKTKNNITILNITIIHVKGNDGIAFFLENGNIFNVSFSNFKNLSALNSGGILRGISLNQIFFSKNAILQVEARFYGGLFYFGLSNTLLFEICKVSNIRAGDGGILFLFQSNNINLFNNSINNIKVEFKGGLMQIIALNKAVIKENNFSNFKALQFTGGFIFGLISNLIVLENVNITDITSENSGGFGYFFTNNEILLKNSSLNFISSKNLGGFLILHQSNLFNSTRSKFSNINATFDGGFLNLNKENKINMTFCSCENITSHSKGGLMEMISKNVVFMINSNVKIIKSKSKGGCFSIEFNNTVNLISSRFDNISIKSNDPGGIFLSIIKIISSK